MTDTTAAQAQENEALGGYVSGILDGVELHVRPAGQWRPSHLRALRAGDYDTWAYGVMPEADAETFIELDATFDDITAFTTAVMESAGEAPGKSGGRSRSSRNTRKR
ncbi:hypothetical protein AB0A77_02115 [Streptomyces varsoviensis]|uniref:hypothetical protein n=1 Tax=Streptomyces varsoviensis TaxID=67373 RepID=UPI003410D8D1